MKQEEESICLPPARSALYLAFQAYVEGRRIPMFGQFDLSDSWFEQRYVWRHATDCSRGLALGRLHNLDQL
jgi:hypothetical protein